MVCIITQQFISPVAIKLWKSSEDKQKSLIWPCMLERDISNIFLYSFSAYIGFFSSSCATLALDKENNNVNYLIM